MGKTAFVTGGSRGIGRAVVRRLAAEGYAVGITICIPGNRPRRWRRSCGSRDAGVLMCLRSRRDGHLWALEE